MHPLLAKNPTNEELITASEAHDVVAAVDVDHFAGDATAGIGSQEDSCRSHFFNLNAAAQRGALFMRGSRVVKSRFLFILRSGAGRRLSKH